MVELLNRTPPYVASALPGHLPLTRFHTGESGAEIPVTVYRREQHLNVIGEPSYHWTPDRTGSVSINPAAQPSLWASRPNSVYSRPAAITEPGEALSELDLSKGPQLIKREREELARKADYRARLRRERILDAKTRDPETVHENQQGLAAFEDIDQADVNPASTTDTDGRLDGLPVFLDESELPDGPGVTDASDTGPEHCDQCGASHPWTEPLERGLNGIRGGGIVDGNSDYEHCDPDDFSSHIIDCECCACPCGSKSIRYRKTKEPAWACNNPNCKREFHHPVKRPDVLRSDVETDAERRARLYWKCRSCGDATQAPFTGIPKELL